MQSNRCLRSWTGRFALLSVFLMFLPAAWAGSKYKVLYSFTGGNDGIDPQGNLVFDAKGNLYGTTVQGGGTSACHGEYQGCGIVFELLPRSGGHWHEDVLYRFQNGSTGGVGLNGNLVIDPAGDVDGTTFYGGPDFQGTVFQLTPGSDGWTESDIYQFCSQSRCTDGASPASGLILDRAGNLYGTATAGGTDGGGVAFELSPDNGGWTESVLFNFCPLNPCNRGGWLPTGLAEDASGNFFGATTYGGHYSWPCTPGDGCGAVVELSPSKNGWKEIALHRFTGPDGAFPESSLTLDKQGNVYGTTTSDGAFGCGTVFQLSPKANGGWRYNVIYDLRDGVSAGSLALDAAGNLYGADSSNGFSSCKGSGGDIFQLSPGSHGRWKYSVIHKLTLGSGGGQPSSGLIFDQEGHLYGTAAVGGANEYGVIFEVTP